MDTTSSRMGAGVRAASARGFRWIAMLFAATVLGLLAACSNGGGGSPPPVTVITQQPTDTQVTAGAPATFSVQASSASQYQWERRAAGSTGQNDWQDIPGANGNQYTTAATTAANDGDAYRVVVTWLGGASVTSSTVTLSVHVAPVAPAIAVQPADTTVVAGQSATFSVTASGTSIAYRWQTSKDGATWTDQVQDGATLQILTQTVDEDGTQVRVIVSNDQGSVTSAVAHMAVQPVPAAPRFGLNPASVAVIAGQPATFSAQAFGAPAPDIAWQTSADGVTWTPIAGATSGSYTTPATTLQDSFHQYRAVATNSLGSATSVPAVLTVSPAPAAPVIATGPASITLGVGASGSFSATVTGQPTPTLQWQVSTDAGATFTNINGATQSSYLFGNAQIGQDGARYRVVATNSQGSATSAAATLSVLALPAFTQQPTAAWWHPGVVPAYYLAGVSGSGATLQWQTSRDGGTTWADVAGATGTSLQLSSVADANVNQVRVGATNAGGTTWSNWASATPSWWTPVVGAPTSSHLAAVRWTSPTSAIAAGANGTMLRSTDSGASWSVVAQFPTTYVTSMAVHGQTVLALGSGWSVLRSVDGGAHWTYVGTIGFPGFATTPNAVAFYGNTATAVAFGGVVERSSDGGATWSAATTDGSTASLYGVAFNAAGVGIATGDASSVLRSTDGGATWSSVAAGQASLRDVAWVDASTVVAVGLGGRVVRSTDAGLTWQTVSVPTTMDLRHVAFDGAGNGTATLPSNAATLHTTDRGQTWAVVADAIDAEAVEYAPVSSAATALAVGTGGGLETSADGGATWTGHVSGPHQVLQGIAFGSPNVAVAVGNGGIILRSTDGGDSWTSVLSPSTTTTFDVAFASAQVAVAVGDGGTIWRSADAGATWSDVSIGGGRLFRAVHFTSATHGVAVSSGGIVYTDDAGLTWHAAATGGAPMVQAVAFGSPLVGVAVGDGIAPGGFGFANGAIMRTTDGGLTWTAIASPLSVDLTSVVFFDANTVVAMGLNGALRSTDGGQTWVAATPVIQANAMSFTSATEGLVVTESGFIGRTHDGGLTWPGGEYVVGDELDNVVVSPAGRTFVITAGGAIYRDDAP